MSHIKRKYGVIAEVSDDDTTSSDDIESDGENSESNRSIPNDTELIEPRRNPPRQRNRPQYLQDDIQNLLKLGDW